MKYQYIFRLVDAMADRLYEALTDHMVAFTGNLSDMKHLVENEQLTKDQLGDKFSSMEASLKTILGKIREVDQLVEGQSLS